MGSRLTAREFMKIHQIGYGKRKYRIVLLPHRIQPFIDAYIRYMRGCQEIPMQMHQTVRDCMTSFAEKQVEKSKQFSDESSNNSTSRFNDNYMVTGIFRSVYSSFGFTNARGDPGVPLTGKEKLHFLLELQCSLQELLFSPVFSSKYRTRFAKKLCKYSEIPKNIYINWFIG